MIGRRGFLKSIRNFTAAMVLAPCFQGFISVYSLEDIFREMVRRKTQQAIRSIYYIEQEKLWGEKDPSSIAGLEAWIAKQDDEAETFHENVFIS